LLEVLSTGGFVVINIKTLFITTVVFAGVTLAVPAAMSQAMPAGPVKVQAAQDNDIVQVNHKWKKKRRESRRWHRHHYWASYCDPWYGCYPRHHARFYRYYDYDYDEPYYGYGGYPYDYPYGGYYGPGFYGPSIGLQFRIH
jgi:hypothetical protein